MKLAYKIAVLFFIVYFSNTTTSLVYGQSNITLLFPLNESNITVDYPLFSWTPISTITANNLIYRYKLVEVLNHQSPQTAIMSNPPIYTKDIFDINFLQYPLDAPSLNKCANYAWQVIALRKITNIGGENNNIQNNLITIGISDVSTFTFDCQSFSSRLSTSVAPFYIIPQKTVDNVVYPVDNDIIRFKYEELYYDKSTVINLKYKIYNWKREIIAQSDNFPISYGWNYLTLDLTADLAQGMAYDLGGIYQLEIETTKGDILKIKFEYQ